MTTSISTTFECLAGMTLTSKSVPSSFGTFSQQRAPDDPTGNEVEIKITVIDSESELPIPNARVWLGYDSDKSQILNKQCDVDGVVTKSVQYAGDVNLIGWVREHNLAGDDYIQQNFSGVLLSSGLVFVIKLKKI